MVFQISCSSLLVKSEDTGVVHNERKEMKLSCSVLPSILTEYYVIGKSDNEVTETVVFGTRENGMNGG